MHSIQEHNELIKWTIVQVDSIVFLGLIQSMTGFSHYQFTFQSHSQYFNHIQDSTWDTVQAQESYAKFCSGVRNTERWNSLLFLRIFPSGTNTEMKHPGSPDEALCYTVERTPKQVHFILEKSWVDHSEQLVASPMHAQVIYLETVSANKNVFKKVSINNVITEKCDIIQVHVKRGKGWGFESISTDVIGFSQKSQQDLYFWHS